MLGIILIKGFVMPVQMPCNIAWNVSPRKGVLNARLAISWMSGICAPNVTKLCPIVWNATVLRYVVDANLTIFLIMMESVLFVLLLFSTVRYVPTSQLVLNARPHTFWTTRSSAFTVLI